MHRSLLGLPILLFLAMSPGLGQQPKKPPLAIASDLFPLKVGNRWLYQGNEPKEKVIVTVDRMELVKRSAPAGDRPDMVESYILRTTNGDKALIEQIMITEDGIYRLASAGKEIRPPLKILKLPPAQDDSWMVDSRSESVELKGEFFVKQSTVNLGRGDEPAWLVKTRDFKVGEQALEASYWFKPGVGIVKQHVKSGKFDLRTTLEEFRPGTGPEIAPGLPLPKDIK
jgi:hypothetical protein